MFKKIWFVEKNVKTFRWSNFTVHDSVRQMVKTREAEMFDLHSVISRTCFDPKSFAWEHEFKIEIVKVLGGIMRRPVEFIYKESGINRSLRSKSEI